VPGTASCEDPSIQPVASRQKPSPHPRPTHSTNRTTQATGNAVKGGIDLATAGAKVIKDGYEVASPYIQQGVEAASPYVQEAVKAAAPVVSKAVPLVQVGARRRLRAASAFAG
jgi:hypothetical protein